MPPRRPRIILVGSVIYLALIFGVMLWRGIEIEPQWVVLALLLIAVAMGRGRQFVQDWSPFLLLFFAYEVMRGFAAKTGFAAHDITGLERFLFFALAGNYVKEPGSGGRPQPVQPARGVSLREQSWS